MEAQANLEKNKPILIKEFKTNLEMLATKAFINLIRKCLTIIPFDEFYNLDDIKQDNN